jgi:glycine/D-amino acid oxidase-like deaminating enzyme
VPVEALARDLEVEVLVVGMGVSGAMVGEELTADGHEVAVIDRRGPLMGSTPASTALVQYEIDQPMAKLVPRIGRERTERAWRRSRLAVANLAGRIEELGIACGMQARRSLYLSGDVLGADALAEEQALRRRAGIEASLLGREALRGEYGIDRAAALLGFGNLALDPRRLTAGMLLAARGRGARLLAPVEAVGFEHSADEVAVATKAGPVVRARQVVLATGYELAPGVPAAGHAIFSTWAIATRRQPRAVWPHAALIWEASEPYLYLRATADGRVVCGGEDEDFTDEAARDALLPAKATAITRKLGRLLPGVDATPEFAWTGSFGATGTGLPIIRRLPRRPRMHAVMGYGGNGITFSRIAAELVATELAGREDSDADLFRGVPG